MKGLDTFTLRDIDAIRRLIDKKVVASKDEQKTIRDELRQVYRFFFSDFSSKKGYSVADLEELIRVGRIQILAAVDTKASTGAISIQKGSETTKSSTRTNVTANPTDIEIILSRLRLNRFSPHLDSESKLDDCPGNYVLCLQSNSKLPSVSIIPIMTRFEGLNVIYTGIAGGSLRTRDYRQHFKGNNSGRSTLRKSLGVLFGYKQVPRDRDVNNGKTKFNEHDERKLTEWMNSNLIMFFLVGPDYWNIEIKLINLLNPPLNLKDNHSMINADFRKLLFRLRTSKHE